MSQIATRVVLAVGTTVALAACGTTVAQPDGIASVTGSTTDGLSTPGADATPPAAAGAVPVGGAAAVPTANRPRAATPALSALIAGPDGRAAAPSSLPARGQGWDEHNVYVGVPTENDTSSYAKAAGFAYDVGDPEADVKAIVDTINRNGGLFGRKVTPVFHDNSTPQLVADPTTAAQADCSYFTQDHKVVAVVSGIPLFPDSYRACLAQHNTPLIDISSTMNDAPVYRQFAPYLYTTLVPNLDAIYRTFVDRLVAQGYFGGWDTSAGKASATKAAVGLYLADDAVSHRIAAGLGRELQRVGHPVKSTYFYGGYGQNDANSAVLQFRGSGVTHIITMPAIAAAPGLLMIAANQQAYFPRYSLNTYNFTQELQHLVPARQLVGSVGIGWSATTDVVTAHDPGDVGAGSRECRASLARAGIRHPGDGGRSALRVAYTLCDGFALLTTAFVAGHGLTVAGLHIGAARAGTRIPLAAVFPPSKLSATSYAAPGAARDLAYDASCSCFVYRGSSYAL